MNLYLISQTANDDYDSFDSAVVAAPSAAAARMIHPSVQHKDWDGAYECSWTDAQYVQVDFIGVAKKYTKHGVICASFNAG